MSFYITKTSGKKEKFDKDKFKISLQKAGADEATLKIITDKLEKQTNIQTTQDIYNFALQELKKIKRPLAAKYNIKQALFQLGPTGYPFEHFIAQIFQNKGYSTQTGIVIKGICVDHEVDLVAHKNNHHILAECKFHNDPRLKTNVKVTLYVKARFIDIENYLKKTEQHTKEFYESWVITNTKFTTQAIQYARCNKINLLGWDYPRKENLADLINAYNLFPITVLTSLNNIQKNELIKKGFVLCRDVRKYAQALESIELNKQQIDEIIAESEGVCEL
jgi:Restriction endonuclease